MVAGNGCGQAGVPHHQGQPVGKEQLGGLERAQPALERGERGKRRARRVQREKGNGAVGEQRPQPDPDRRDHAKSSLGPREQADQVEARVVLGERLEARHHRAIGKHRLQTHDLLARAAVPKDANTARVRGDQPADRGRVPGREVDAEVEPQRANNLMQGGECHACAEGDLSPVTASRGPPR